MEIFSRYSWQEIEPSYVKLYPEEKRKKRKAREAFAYIQTLNLSNMGMRIDITYREDEDGSYHEFAVKMARCKRMAQKKGFVLQFIERLDLEIDRAV